MLSASENSEVTFIYDAMPNGVTILVGRFVRDYLRAILVQSYDWTIYSYIFKNYIRKKIEFALLFSLQFCYTNNYKGKLKIMQYCILLYLFAICRSRENVSLT